MPSKSDPVRGVLVEELANAERRLAMYDRAIKALPHGSLASRKIKGRAYYYIASWQSGKVRHAYRGRLPAAEIRRYEDAKRAKARYRRLMADLRARIVFIRRALHERKRRAV